MNLSVKHPFAFDNVIKISTVFVVLIVWYKYSFDSIRYIELHTAVVISIESMLLYILINYSAKRKLGMLCFFLIMYALYWNLRHATYVIWPEYPGLLSTNFSASDYTYSVIISIIGLIFTILGSLSAYEFNKLNTARWFTYIKGGTESGGFKLDQRLQNWLLIYAITGMFWSIYFNSIGFYDTSLIQKYVGILFDSRLVLFALFTSLMIGGAKKFGWGIIVIYVTISTLQGTRSGLITVITVLMLFLYLLHGRVYILLSIKHIFILIILVPLILITYLAGTAQRDLRDRYGQAINVTTINHITQSISNIADIDDKIGNAFARAGYSHIAYHRISDKRYSKIITIPNISKSIVNNLIPGEIFNNAERVSFKLSRVGGGDSSFGSINDYSSQAIGVFAENYILFGAGYLIIVFLFTFIVTSMHLMNKGQSHINLFIDYTLGSLLLEWLNSFGYDWLIIENVRNFLVGIIVLYVLNGIKNISLNKYYYT